MKAAANQASLLLLFDIDGTLVHVDGAGRAALRFAMEEVYGETGPIDSFDFHGRTDPAIVRGLLHAVGRKDRWIDRGMPRLWKEYVEALQEELGARGAAIRICPGVSDVLARVADDPRIVAGLLTGNVEPGAWTKLGACGLAAHFAFGAYGSDSEWREDLPPLAVERARRSTGAVFPASRVLVIGDTPEDIRCAKASQMLSVAVATGRYSEGDLAEHGADTVMLNLIALGPVLDAMLAGQQVPGAEAASSRKP